MASYTKRLPVEIHNIWSGEIKTETYLMDYNGSGPESYRVYLIWDGNQVPQYKRVKKLTFEIYGGQSDTRRLSFQSGGDVLSYHSFDFRNGYNEISIDKNYTEPYRSIQLSSFPSSAILYTHNSTAKKPYVTITYEDVPPNTPTSLYPDKTTINTRNTIRFSWEHKSNEATYQKGFTLQYSVDQGGTWTTITQTTSLQYYDMPANTLPTTGEVWWRVKTKDQNDLDSPYTADKKVTLELVPQRPPTLVSPTGGYLNGSDSIRLQWSFNGGTAEDKQAKYELQYSANGVSWITITKTTDLQYHEFKKDFFRSGRVEWKVKTFNTFGDESEFTDIVAFNVISSPPIPQIQTITNSSRPKISWISIEQQYYEIRIYDNSNKLIYGIKEPSINKFHDVKIFLNDGNYRAELVIFNQYNLNSETATKDFTISTVKPPSPIIEVYSGEYSNTIRGNSNTQYTRVYRDNIFIGTLENNIFIDFTCENRKEYKYHLRAIDDEGNFSDSDIKVGICNFRNNTISTAKSPGDFIKLKYGLNSIPSKNTRKAISGSNFYFDGREYPVVEFSEFKAMEKSLKFFTRDKSDIDKLEELINKKEILFYRDVEGEIIYGTILSIDYDEEMLGYNFGFTIQKTDYSGDLDD